LIFAQKQLLRSYYLPEPQGTALLAELQAYPLVKRVSARSNNRERSRSGKFTN
jgi:hypothetical protein